MVKRSGLDVWEIFPARMSLREYALLVKKEPETSGCKSIWKSGTTGEGSSSMYRLR